ncbi:MAG: hydroxyethylthiazole kinase-like uncharacterized protein yjeF [Kiritimatiellia bacterium]
MLTRVVTASQARAHDRRVIEDLGVPGICLMETASRAVARRVQRELLARPGGHVVVVCGGGNNGGDGYGCARWLASWGLPVKLWSLATSSAADAGVMRETCARVGVERVSDVRGATVIVDAIFGVGLNRDVTGAYADVIDTINASSAVVVSVDLPSGLNADTGAVMGVAIRANATVTFGSIKVGLVTEPGADYAGDIVVADIGLGEPDFEPAGYVATRDQLAPLWPRRLPGDHKTRAGHLLVVAGSRNLAGAAVLACRGALSAGVGLLTLVASRGTVGRLTALPPEVMVYEFGTSDMLANVPRQVLERRTALLAGPGLGGGIADLHRDLAASLADLWTSSSVPMIFDADALSCAVGAGRGPRVITPHPGEAGRMLGCSPQDVQADRFAAVARLTTGGTVALLKGRNTLVGREGGATNVNPTGNAILATGGSGDVLAGIIGALLARGLSAWDAARLGAWVHGRAADLLATRRSHGWTAGDVADAVPDAIDELVAL